MWFRNATVEPTAVASVHGIGDVTKKDYRERKVLSASQNTLAVKYKITLLSSCLTVPPATSIHLV